MDLSWAEWYRRAGVLRSPLYGSGVSEDWIRALRHDYESEPFGMGDAHPEPMTQFGRWFEEAVSAELDEPNAMVLSTAGPDGKPDARAVLMKSFDASGFVFFSNYGSKKAVDMEHNRWVSLLFVWIPIHRQVRIQGWVERIPAEQSDDYFSTRPLGARIGAVASPQSKEIPSREWLHERFEEVSAGADESLARPTDWGGYQVEPAVVEFWQGRPNRLHDRIRYTRTDRGWVRVRLAP